MRKHQQSIGLPMALLLQSSAMRNARQLENDPENRKSSRWADHDDPADWTNTSGAFGGIEGGDRPWQTTSSFGLGGGGSRGCRRCSLSQRLSGGGDPSAELLALHQGMDAPGTR